MPLKLLPGARGGLFVLLDHAGQEIRRSGHLAALKMELLDHLVVQGQELVEHAIRLEDRRR